jgi:cytochrome c553
LNKRVGKCWGVALKALGLGVGWALAATAAAQDPATAPPEAQPCLACHQAQAPAGNDPYPILAGQNARYIYLQLRDFQEGRRSDPVMTPMAANLTRDQMRAIAQWFSALKPLSQTAMTPDPEKARLGKAKSDETLCPMCHLGGFSGQNEIPRVAGQHYAYVVKQLSDFKARRRTNDAGNMTAVSATLSQEDIENLAHYIAGL